MPRRMVGRDPGPILIGQQVAETGAESNMSEPRGGAVIPHDIADLESGDVVGHQAGIDSLGPAAQASLPLGVGLQVPRRYVVLLGMEYSCRTAGCAQTCSPCRPSSLATSLLIAG